MSDRDRMAEALAPLRKELTEARTKALGALDPLHEKREAALAKVREAEAELRVVNEEIERVERETDIKNISSQLAAIARASGSRTLANG